MARKKSRQPEMVVHGETVGAEVQENLLEVPQDQKSRLQLVCEKMSDLEDKMGQLKAAIKETEVELYEEMVTSQLKLFSFNAGNLKHTFYMKSSKIKMEHNVELALSAAEPAAESNGEEGS